MVHIGGGTTLYMQVGVGSAIVYTGVTDVASASVFTIDVLNRLVTLTADPEIASSYNSLSNYYMEGMQHAYLDTHSQYFTALTCAVNSDYTLTCNYKAANVFTYYAGQKAFFYGSAGYNGFPTYIANLIVQ